MNIERPKPITIDALANLIDDTIHIYGPKCDLNFIDISQITNMSYLFSVKQLRRFKGDISGWDVSNVINMEGMFEYSEFTGDISKWDVSNVKYMTSMFYDSKFTGNIDNWNISNVRHMNNMFYNSELEKQNKLPIWYKD